MTEPVVPPSVRHHRPGWRDPRILVGIMILAASVLLGVKVFAAADDTVGVWAVARDLPAGARIDAAELRRVRIRFASTEDADRYLSADAPVPSEAVLRHAVGSGELLARTSLGGPRQSLVEVPVSVDVDEVPSTIREGSIVDVWVTPQSAVADRKPSEAVQVLDDVVVVRAAEPGDSLAPSGTRQIIVGVPSDRADDLGPALGRTTQGHVVITRQG